MKLVVNLNSTRCKIYQYIRASGKLILLKEINHPETRLKGMDLTSDKPGRYKGPETSRGAYQPRTEAKEVEVENFSREVAKVLNLERQQNEYDGFIIITPPHMYGLLANHLDKQVKELIINNIQKDVVFLKDHELIQFLKKNAEFPNKV